VFLRYIGADKGGEMGRWRQRLKGKEVREAVARQGRTKTSPHSRSDTPHHLQPSPSASTPHRSAMDPDTSSPPPDPGILRWTLGFILVGMAWYVSRKLVSVCSVRITGENATDSNKPGDSQPPSSAVPRAHTTLQHTPFSIHRLFTHSRNESSPSSSA
jgi:hypothetical protein